MMIQVSSLKVLAGAALAATVALAQAAPALVVNGDFETGNLSGWTSFVNTGGAIGTPTAVSADVVEGASSLAAQLRVGHVEDLTPGSGGGLKQAFTVGSAGDYKVYADIMSAGNVAFTNADGGSFSLFIDATRVASYAFGRIVADTPERSALSGVLALTAGSHEIRLEAVRDYMSSENTPFQYFDNVSVVAVPEAGTHALMLLGLGLVGGAQAWRRRQAA